MQQSMKPPINMPSPTPITTAINAPASMGGGGVVWGGGCLGERLFGGEVVWDVWFEEGVEEEEKEKLTWGV